MLIAVMQVCYNKMCQSLMVLCFNYRLPFLKQCVIFVCAILPYTVDVSTFKNGTVFWSTLHRKLQQESRAVTRKPRDTAAVLFGLKFTDNITTSLRVAKLRKPCFRAPKIPAHNRI